MRRGGLRTGLRTASQRISCMPRKWRLTIAPVRFHWLQEHVFGLSFDARHELPGRAAVAEGVAGHSPRPLATHPVERGMAALGKAVAKSVAPMATVACADVWSSGWQGSSYLSGS